MKHLILLAPVALVACNTPFFQGLTGEDGAPAATAAAPAPTLDPTPAPPPPVGANTVDALDTTTQEDRDAALAAPAEPEGEQRLGTTLATLGSPADPGIWIETPLVTELVMGRAEVAATGKTVNLELRPSGAEEGSGSEISLPAMRLLEVPLTAIQELVLYRS